MLSTPSSPIHSALEHSKLSPFDGRNEDIVLAGWLLALFQAEEGRFNTSAKLMQNPTLINTDWKVVQA